MDKATLRPHVFEILKKTPQTHFHAIENDLRKLVESYERHDVLTLQEILWELLVQGVLAPGKNSLNLNLPFVHLTEYGALCLDDGCALAHDPDRYLEKLADTVGNRIDAFVLNSVREALAVFLGGNWSAAVILLARIAEHLFDQLADALVNTNRSDGGESNRLETLGCSSLNRAQGVIQSLQQYSLPEQEADVVEPQLNGLLGLIQLSRSQDGAPRWTRPSRDQVLGFFLLFPEQCAFVYHLINRLVGGAAN